MNQIIKKRQKNIDLYKKLITAKEFQIINEKKNCINSNTMFISVCERRDQLHDYLRGKEIEALIYYGKALHQPAFLKSLEIKYLLQKS